MISDSFRKKNPHEISSEHIFNEDISGINYVPSSSRNNHKLNFDKKILSNDISNLQREYTYQKTNDNELSNDNHGIGEKNDYEYSLTDNSKFIITSEESNMKSFYNNNKSSKNLN